MSVKSSIAPSPAHRGPGVAARVIAPAAALLLAACSAVVHVVAAAQGESWWLVGMAALCCVCAVTAYKSRRAGDWMAMGVASAAMVCVHLLLVEAPETSGSLGAHLAAHLAGRGFDLSHLGTGLVGLEALISLALLAQHARRCAQSPENAITYPAAAAAASPRVTR